MQLVKRSQILSLDKKKHHIHHHVTTELAVGHLLLWRRRKIHCSLHFEQDTETLMSLSLLSHQYDKKKGRYFWDHCLSSSFLQSLSPSEPTKSFTTTSSAHHCNFAVCSSVPTIHKHHTSGLQRTFCSPSQFLNYCLCESIFYFLFHALTDSSGYASPRPILTQCPTENWCIAWFNKAL